MTGGGDEGPKEEEEEEKVSGRKVYSRRSFKGLESTESSSDLLRDQHQLKAQSTVSGCDVGSDNFFDFRSEGLVFKGEFLLQENKVRISLSVKSKSEALELKRKLEAERDAVRSMMMKIEATERQKNEAQGFDDTDGDKEAVGMQQPRMLKPMNQLSVKVYENSKAEMDDVKKEKRMPKANKFYKSSAFLRPKDKIVAESNKKLTSKGKKGGDSELGMKKLPNQVLQSCSAVLERLMKHKHGWVFNKPVDAVALGLHDYLEIIKNPMDLGTVKNRLSQNCYKSPMEFAKDVRLTFQNAMTYNPKGQDVYLMAEQLSKIFEDKWLLIDRELKSAADFVMGSPTPPNQKAPPQSRTWPHKKKTVIRAEPMVHSRAPERKIVNTARSDKSRVLKKPKAKDPAKREMTYDEKQKLSINLQNLPSEKLESVVQIIKKRNPSVSQQDDEIELDIDSVDTETLWELDRFIINYKKSLSKKKRIAAIVSPVLTDQGQKTAEKITDSVAMEMLKGSTKKAVAPHVEAKHPQHRNSLQGASQSSSRSDSGSSSSDVKGKSVSADESDDEPSPKKLQSDQ